jgi:hypothetical protein
MSTVSFIISSKILPRISSLQAPARLAVVSYAEGRKIRKKYNIDKQ